MRTRTASNRGLPCWLLAGLAVISSSICLAQSIRLDLDPEKTSISFSLPATLHVVKGTMGLERGSLVLDATTGRAQGEVVVSSRSAETGHKGRDRAMHRKVLDSERFPSMAFYPERVVGLPVDGETVELTVEGWIEVQGERHPVVWLASVDREVGYFSTEIKFDVPYVEWGLKDPSNLLLRVGKIVRVRIWAEGTLETS